MLRCGSAVLAVLGRSGLCGCWPVWVWQSWCVMVRKVQLSRCGVQRGKAVRVWFVRARPVAEWSGSRGWLRYSTTRRGVLWQSGLGMLCSGGVSQGKSRFGSHGLFWCVVFLCGQVWQSRQGHVRQGMFCCGGVRFGSRGSEMRDKVG